jgi:hypothetical protein
VGLSAVSEGKRDTVYVADVFAYRSVDGSSGAVTDLQRSHAADARIGYANGVSASAQHVLVINSNGTLQKYRRQNGELLKEWLSLRGLTGAVEMTNGDLVVAQGGALVSIDARDQRKTIAENLGRVQSLWLAGDRGICFLNVDAGEIVHIDFANGAKRVIASNLKTPQGLVVDSRGQLITVEFDSKRLLSIDPESGKATEIASGLPINFRDSERAERAIGLTIGGSGAIYMTSDVENSIYKFTPQ